MRFTMLQLLKNLRSHSQGKEITDADILNWANNKVKKAGRTSEMESFKVIKQKIASSEYTYIDMYAYYLKTAPKQFIL